MRREPSPDGPSRLPAAARLARAGGITRSPPASSGRRARGGEQRLAAGAAPLFPLDPDGHEGGPIAFLAGDPLAHDEARRDVRLAGYEVRDSPATSP